MSDIYSDHLLLNDDTKVYVIPPVATEGSLGGIKASPINPSTIETYTNDVLIADDGTLKVFNYDEQISDIRKKMSFNDGSNDTWNETTTYETNSYVLWDNKLWRCTYTNSGHTPGFDELWELVNLTSINSKLDSTINDTYRKAQTYTQGEVQDYITGKNYITKAVNNLDNYYTKSNVYTKSEIDNKKFLTQHQSLSNYYTKAQSEGLVKMSRESVAVGTGGTAAWHGSFGHLIGAAAIPLWASTILDFYWNSNSAYLYANATASTYVIIVYIYV